MIVTGKTTLEELEQRLRSLGLCCHAALDRDGRFVVQVTDTVRIADGRATSSSLPEAIGDAINDYLVNVFGPHPTRKEAAQ